MVQVAFHGSASNQKKSCGCLIWANRVITLERGQAPSQLQYKKNAVHVSKPSNTNYQLRMRFTTHLWIFMVSSRSELGMVDSFIYRMTHGLTQVSRSCATDNTQNGDIDMVLKNAFLESPQNGYCYCNPHVWNIWNIPATAMDFYLQPEPRSLEDPECFYGPHPSSSP